MEHSAERQQELEQPNQARCVREAQTHMDTFTGQQRASPPLEMLDF